MAKGNFDKAHARIRVYEGGNVDDPRDPGGRTSRGVTQRVFTAWCQRNGLKPFDVYKASDAQIAKIYKELYWDRCACDDLPAGIDLVVFDSAVNSGVNQASKWAQRAANYTPQGNSGGFGYLTVQKLQTQNDNDAFIARMMAHRLGTLKTLKHWKTYKNGWSARIANVTKIGQAWATGSIGPMPVNVVPLMGNVKANVEDEVAKPTISTTAAASTSAATVVASTATDMMSQAEILRGVFTWAPYVLGALAVVIAIATVVIRIQHAKAERAERGEEEIEVDLYADDMAQPVLVDDSKSVEILPVPSMPGTTLGSAAT